MEMKLADKKITQPEFLPLSRREMEQIGWDEIDVLIVSGDAYVDHPAFGPALLGRWLGAHGFRVGIVAQPRWDTVEDIIALGRPRLLAGVTAGALDSMLAHYTAFRKKRRDDAYTPGGKAGARPNRACLVYTSLIRNAFPGLPVALGGIEASLRRATHYDFWSDRLRRSILLDSKADLVAYGMGERAVLAMARRISDWTTGEGRGEKKISPAILAGIPGTVFTVAGIGSDDGIIPAEARLMRLPSHEDIRDEPAKLMEATLSLERQVHDGKSWAIQACAGREVVIAPPASPLNTAELDALYALPFTRRPHPSYREPIPALTMIQFSITTHRGCGGGCSFCSLALHQGRRVSSRSAGSVLAEARSLASHPDFKGSVTDVGGPSANMWGARCSADPAQCKRVSCLHPELCPHFKDSQDALADLLRDIARQDKIANVRVASGVRHDLALRDEKYMKELIAHFVGGQLKLAPEHMSGNVLKLMRKPPFRDFVEFMERFAKYGGAVRKEQYVVPYLISAFPGCSDADMRQLADWFGSQGWKPRQVQCFIPAPGTVATAMYYAGIDPFGRRIPVARSDADRLRQHYILIPADDDSRQTRPAKPGLKPARPRR